MGKLISRALWISILAIFMSICSPISHSNTPTKIEFIEVGIDGWISMELTRLDIRYTGDEPSKYSDCRSFHQQFGPWLRYEVAGKSYSDGFGSNITTLRILPNGLECRYRIGLAYNGGTYLEVWPLPTTLFTEALISIGVGNNTVSSNVIASTKTRWRTSGVNDLKLVQPTRGSATGNLASLEFSYSLANDELSPSEWFVLVSKDDREIARNTVTRLSGKNTSEKIQAKFPSDGLFVVEVRGTTTLSSCLEPVTHPRNGRACPTKTLEGKFPVLIDSSKPNTAEIQRGLSIQCDSVSVFNTSSCSVLLDSKDPWGARAEDGKIYTLQISLSLRGEKLLDKSVSATVGKPLSVELPRSESPIQIEASNSVLGLSQKSIAPLVTYTEEEKFDSKVNLSCEESKSKLNCKASLTLTARHTSFQSPQEIPYQVFVKAFSNTGPESTLLTSASLRNGVITSFTIPYDKSINSVEFISSFASSEWQNNNFVEPVIAFNSSLKLSCPERYSGSKLSCNAKLTSSSTSKSPITLFLERKSGGKWQLVGRKQITPNASSKVDFPTLSSNFSTRAYVNLAGARVMSKSTNWSVDVESSKSNKPTPKPQPSLSAQNQKACKLWRDTMSYVSGLPLGDGRASLLYIDMLETVVGIATGELLLSFRVMLKNVQGQKTDTFFASEFIYNTCSR